MNYKELSNHAITQACGQLEEYCSSQSMDSKESLRLVLTVEELLLHYQAHFGTEKAFRLRCGKRWGQPGFTLSVRGESVDPFAGEEDDDSDETSFVFRNLKNSLGLVPSWSYSSGCNTISYTLPKKKVNSLVQLLFAIIAACVMGALGLVLPQSVTTSIMTLVDPLFDTFMGMLSAISGPMVFLSVAWSICSIGDMATLGKIGSVVSGRFIAMTFALTALGGGVSMLFFSLTYSQDVSTGNGMVALYEMILDIIPANIVTPFTENNLLQIIFMAVVFGTAILILNNRLQVLPNFISDFSVVILQIMQWINIFLPAFVFISLWRLFWTSDATVMAEYSMPLLVYYVGILCFAAYYILAACWKWKLSIAAFVQTILPSFLIAVSTASSAAAYTTNVEISEKKLGIDQRVTSFGIPLGQVVYMPCCALLFFVISLSIASIYEMEVTPVWMVMCFVISAVLSIATPPIPNGPVVCFGILFAQLGISDDAMTLAVIMNALTTNICVAANLLCRQCDLLLAASKLDMVDVSCLESACKRK